MTIEVFRPLIGKPFTVSVSPDQIVEIELIGVQTLPTYSGRMGPRRESFSLVFRGSRNFVMPQRTYELEQAALGKTDIFLVPIGPDGIGQRYEAVFN